MKAKNCPDYQTDEMVLVELLDNMARITGRCYAQIEKEPWPFDQTTESPPNNLGLRRTLYKQIMDCVYGLHNPDIDECVAEALAISIPDENEVK
jgi:hypothetical protein